MITKQFITPQKWQIASRFISQDVADAIAKWGTKRVGVSTLELIGIDGGMELATFLGWIGLAIVVIATVLDYIFTKTPLENWLYHGPFGIEPSKRFIDQWVKLKSIPIAEQSLYNMLYGFQVEYNSKLFKGTTLTVTCPIYTAKTVLHYQLEMPDLIHKGQLIKIPLQQGNLQTKDGAMQVQLTYKDSLDLDEKTFSAWLDIFGDGAVIIPGRWDGAQFKPTPKVVTIPPNVPLFIA